MICIFQKLHVQSDLNFADVLRLCGAFMVTKLNNLICIQGVVIAVFLKVNGKTSNCRFSHTLHYPDISNLNWLRPLVKGYWGILLAITLLFTEGHEVVENAKPHFRCFLESWLSIMFKLRRIENGQKDFWLCDLILFFTLGKIWFYNNMYTVMLNRL